MCRGIAAILVAGSLALCPPVRAGTAALEPGGKMVTGGANLLYKGGEFAELVAVSLVHLFVAALSDSDSYKSYDDGHFRAGDEVDIDISAVQVDTGLGLFIMPGLALGGRFMLQGDLRHKGGHTLGGAGPELTFFWNGSRRPWQPYLGAGFIFSRGLDADRRDHLIDTGTSMLFRSGIYSRTSSTGGVFMQVTYQKNHLQTLYGETNEITRFGLGLGFTGFF